MTAVMGHLEPDCLDSSNVAGAPKAGASWFGATPADEASGPWPALYLNFISWAAAMSWPTPQVPVALLWAAVMADTAGQLLSSSCWLVCPTPQATGASLLQLPVPVMADTCASL